MAKKNEIEEVKNNVQVTEDYEISNQEIKSYIEEIKKEQKRKQFIDKKLAQEDGKIKVLTGNIDKLEKVNHKLEEETMEANKEGSYLEDEIMQLKLSLEKAEADTRVARVKQIKRDILASTKILKVQEENIEQLKVKKEAIRLQRERQRQLLESKRDEIMKINKDAIDSEIINVDAELRELMQTTLASHSDKTQIISMALQEAEIGRQPLSETIELSDGTTEEPKETIDDVKTQLISLSMLTNHSDLTEEMEVAKVVKKAAKLAPKKSSDIENEMQYVNKLNKLIEDGVMDKATRDRELLNFQRANALKRIEKGPSDSSGSQSTEVDKKEEKRIKKLLKDQEKTAKKEKKN